MQDLQNPYTPTGGLVDGACGYGRLSPNKWPYWAVAGISPQGAQLLASNISNITSGLNITGVSRASLLYTSCSELLLCKHCIMMSSSTLLLYGIVKVRCYRSYRPWSTITVILYMQTGKPLDGCGECLSVICNHAADPVSNQLQALLPHCMPEKQVRYHHTMLCARVFVRSDQGKNLNSVVSNIASVTGMQP